MKKTHIILHHSITPRDQDPNRAELGINRTHMERGFPLSKLDYHIGYQYICYGGGLVKQYRKDEEVGAHCKQSFMNYRSIGILCTGNFDKEMPSEKQIESLKKLLNHLTKKYKIPIKNILPHRHFAKYKTCFGKNLPDEWGQDLLIKKTMLINKQQLEKIYQLVFKRSIDNDAMGYIGKDLDFVMDELLKSKEHQYYSEVFKSVKRIEKEL